MKEAPTLRLAENRIRIQATAAELLWKHNEKRARALFKQATDSFIELMASEEVATSAQAEYVLDSYGISQPGRHPGLLQARAQLRQELLQLLANHDAKLARAFLRASSGNRNREGAGYDGGEREMDLNLAANVAASDPKQALQIAEEHLEKGLPYGLANVLSQLQRKDKEAAAKLAGGIMKKLRSENMATSSEAVAFALLLLGQAGESGEPGSSSAEAQAASKNLPLLDENSIRELVEMLVSAALSQSTKPADSDDEDDAEEFTLLDSLEELMPKVEKYAPSRASLLRKKLAEYEGSLDPDTKVYKEYQTAMQKGDSRALMEAAAKASPEMKVVLARQAIIKAIGEGEFDSARQMINENVTDAAERKLMLANIDRQMLQRASMQGKLDDARPLLSRLSTEERATLLTQF
ncbi:MAG TPA: hypothetical protein VF747_06040, partial [Blastocatellia bacterium]